MPIKFFFLISFLLFWYCAHHFGQYFLLYDFSNNKEILLQEERLQLIEQDLSALRSVLRDTLEPWLHQEAIHYLQNGPLRSGPFSEKTCLFLAKGNRIVLKQGKPPDYLPDNVLQEIATGFSLKGKAFERRFASFNPRSLSWDEMPEMEGKLQFLITRTKHCAFYFLRQGTSLFFYIIDLENLDHNKIKQTSRQMMHLSTGNPDTISSIWNGVFLTLFLITLFFAYKIDRSETLSQRAFWIIFFIFSSLLCVSLMLTYFRLEALERDCLKNFGLEANSQIKGLDAQFEKYTKSLLVQFEKDLDSQPLPNCPFESCSVSRISSSGDFLFHPKTLNPAALECMINAAPLFLASQGLMQQTTDSIIGSETLLHQLREIANPSSDGILSVDDFRGLIAPFLNHGFGQWNHFILGSQSAYMFWTIRQEEVIQVLVTSDKLEDGFLQKNLLQANFCHLRSNQQEEKPFSCKAKNLLPVRSLNLSETAIQEEQSGRIYYALKPAWLFNGEIVLISTIQNVLQPVFERKMLYFACILIAALIFLFYARKNLGQTQAKISELKNAIYRVKTGQPIQLKPVWDDEISRSQQAFLWMVQSLYEKEKATPFVARQLLQLFTLDGRIVKTIHEEATVMFSDVREFTTLSESWPAESVVSMLNEYFAIWQDEVDKRSGVIEKFIGDALVVIFFKNQVITPEKMAMDTALAVHARLKTWNSQRKTNNLFEIRCGIGIASGTVRLSIVGDETKRHFFLKGRPVEVAETLEALSKKGQYSQIICDEETASKLNGPFEPLGQEGFEYKSS